jgi:hypothetical protein
MPCAVPRPERGTTPSGFRHQLLARLRNSSQQQGVSAQRLQHRVAFESLLARLSHDHWLLKGGFAFAGIDPVRFPAYPITQHLAEKLHAYTLPRDEENTRTKDLVDLVALAALESVDGDRLIASLRATFSARTSHGPPDVFPKPPERWSPAFRTLLAESPATPIANLEEGHELAAQFWNPVLARKVSGMGWVPSARRWSA